MPKLDARPKLTAEELEARRRQRERVLKELFVVLHVAKRTKVQGEGRETKGEVLRLLQAEAEANADEPHVEELLREYLDDVTGPPRDDDPFFIQVERELKALLRLLQFKAMVEEGDDDNYTERLKRALGNVHRAAKEAHTKLLLLRNTPTGVAVDFEKPYLNTYLDGIEDHLNRLDALAHRCDSSNVRDALRIELEPGRRRAVSIAEGGLGPHLGPLAAGALTLLVSGIVWWQFSTFPPLEALAGPVFLIPPLLAVTVGMAVRRKLDDQNVRLVRGRFVRALAASHAPPSPSVPGGPPVGELPAFAKLRKFLARKLVDEPRDLNEFRLPLQFWQGPFGEQPSNDPDEVAIDLRPKIFHPFWEGVKGVLRPAYANILPLSIAGAVSFLLFSLASVMLSADIHTSAPAGSGLRGASVAGCPEPKDVEWLDVVFNPRRCTTTVIGLDGRGDECIMARGTIRWSGLDRLYLRPNEETDQRAGPIVIVPRDEIRRIEYATNPALPLCAEVTSFALIGGQPWALAVFLNPVRNASSDPQAAFAAAEGSVTGEYGSKDTFARLAKVLASCGTDSMPFAIDVLGFASNLQMPAVDPDAHNHALAEGRRAYVLSMLREAVIADPRLAYRITVRDGSGGRYIPIEHLPIPLAGAFASGSGNVAGLRFASYADMAKERDKWVSDGDPGAGLPDVASGAERVGEAFTRSVVVVPARGCRIVWPSATRERSPSR